MADKYEDEILEGEVSDDDDQEENKKEPEKYCTLCHRAESQVGKMIDLPNNIHICPDCMQRSFDSMNQQMQTGNFNYGDLLNMPNVSMIDLSSFQHQMGQQKKPKKKKLKVKIFSKTITAKEISRRFLGRHKWIYGLQILCLLLLQVSLLYPG